MTMIIDHRDIINSGPDIEHIINLLTKSVGLDYILMCI